MRRHDNEMNLQTDKRPGGSQHDMGWRARRTSSLLPVAGEVFLLTLPFIERACGDRRDCSLSEPKNPRSKASIPVVKQQTEALEAHRRQMGKLAVGPIFQSGNGSPMNLDNLARGVIIPALERCEFCEQPKSEHQTDEHQFVRDNRFPRWQQWHAFRRETATNLHQLGVADKDIQAILRHSNIGITMNIYVKSVAESQVDAMDLLGEELEMRNSSEISFQQQTRVN